MAQGKRAGARPKRRFRPILLGLALGVTAAVVAWGYLVLAAIDFGTSARDGDETAWWFLAIAAVGAVLCLFLALVLVARIGRALGVTRAPTSDAPSAAPDEPGGRRAAR
ncbi:hypothetical protein [Nocardioides sp.]|uniref:hypothetical protein n=1 Tax=Nocardioides sp. TaxID=35761 RepID=UPI002725D066|nr:hypothetical protein [Nocardioides sp.]MDO9457261.1 hypothetical protein [Nocardioides sp.]